MPITLTTPLLVQFNRVTVEDDTIGAVTTAGEDYLGNSVSFVLRSGVLNGNNFNAGIYPATVNVTMNLVTGAWVTSDGRSGTTDPGTLNSVNALLANVRNQLEIFASGASNIMPGTQFSITTLSS